MEPSKSDSHIQYNPVQHENVEPLHSSQSFQNANPRSNSVKPVLNYSIRTGEEFALEFMRDRVNPRMPSVAYHAGDPSRTPGYLELKGILGISHTGSESGSDISMVNIVERGSTRFDNNHQTSSDFNSSRGSESSPKIKILCSFGGKILPRPSDGKLRYVGGNTRIIRIRKDIFWHELRQKALEIYIETYAIKYQLPGEDLDALVSVSCDEDLQNMLEECNVLGVGEGSQKLRLFLFSLSDLEDSSFNHVNSGGDNEFQFVVAVNGMDMGSRRESGMHGLMTSSANNLSDLDGQNVERNTSPSTFIDLNVPSNAYGNLNQMHHGEANLDTSVPQKEEKPKGDSHSTMKQDVKQTNIRSPRDDVSSTVVPPGEGKLPPKPKMNEDRNQDQMHAKVVTSIDNDSYTAGSAAGPDNSGSDLIDLSYLEPPSRVYHSERIPRGQIEKNRLTKSDDSLGSQLLATHLQSDSDPISESVGNLRTEEFPPQITHGGLVNNEKSNEAPKANTDLVPDSEAAMIEKKVKFDKPSETGSQVKHHPQNSQATSGGDQTFESVSRPEQGAILIDINDRFPSDFLSDVFARAISEDSHGIGVLPQDGVGLSMNIANHEPQHWSFFQKLAQNEFQGKDVSLIDQDPRVFLSKHQNAQDEASVHYNVSQFPDDMTSRNTFVEDEAKEIHASESTSMQPHYNPSLVKNSEGVQFDDLAGNYRMPDSDYEVETRNDGLPSLDSLGDLDISSLQTVEFWREAVILSKLHHPNVMAFYGVVQDGPDGTLATVTEFMVDGSLRHVLLRKDRHLDHRKRLIIAMDAAFGMEYLHSKNIVHFDLKCDNLL
ncbi:hypothetical protein M8C21_023857, partial [Ambrosia artemisiifolia]